MANNPFKYKFQGQELQDEHNLNWYSYRYRNYDPAIGRFFNVDPLTEQYHEWGAYVFSGNRVVDSFELEGLEPVEAGKYDGETQMQSDMQWTWSAESGDWGIALNGATVFGGNTQSVQNSTNDALKIQMGGASFLNNDFTVSSTHTSSQQGFILPGLLVASELAKQTAVQTTVAEATGSTLSRSMGILSLTLLLYGDSPTDNEKKRNETYYYRIMKPDTDGFPLIGNRYGELGVRVPQDMKPIDGLVGWGVTGPSFFGNFQGMSLYKRKPNNVDPKYYIYKIREKDVAPFFLTIQSDAGNHATMHLRGMGTIPLPEFRQRLGNTKYLWKRE